MSRVLDKLAARIASDATRARSHTFATLIAYQVVDVLAGAYRGKCLEQRALLSHALVKEKQTGIERVLCPIPIDSLADYSSAKFPSCPTCAKRLTKLLAS